MPAQRTRRVDCTASLLENPSAGIHCIAQLRANAEKVPPVIFLSQHDDWQTRLAAVRNGSQSFLTKPVDYIELGDHLDRLLRPDKEYPYRIMIVDDTALLARHYAEVLQAAGMETVVVNDPSQLLEVMYEFNPELIVMDLYMPGCNGTEAARVVRQCPSYSNLPIIYLSTESALQEQLAALRVGGDDFLNKPISDAHLVAAVSMRAQRFRGLNALMNRDSLTGLIDHINMKLALEKEIVETQRRGGCFSFVMVDIDHFKTVNDKYGHPMGDRVIIWLARLLKQRLRKSDIAARYGGEEFALILPDTGSSDALSTVNELRKTFSTFIFASDKGQFAVSFSAGIASVPYHSDVESVIKAADTALYEAKRAGRNQVLLENTG